jgi:hypothetical protein
MTLINGIEIDHIRYIRNPIKETIKNNDPNDTTLHVIVVVSNPCQYASRYILTKEFLYRMQFESNITIYVVELAYSKQKFHITSPNCPRHLQLRTDKVIWHKENMINMGVKLLPMNWKSMAWIDADIEMESNTWAMDTLKLLNGAYDVVQLFSHCIDMNKNGNTMSIFPSFCYQYMKQTCEYNSGGKDLWHPGYAWAMNRKTYDRCGIYDQSILGSGDHNMALSFLGYGIKSLNENVSDGYKKTIENYQYNVKGIRMGYVPGVIRHYYHGSKEKRKYTERWKILVKHQFDPLVHLKYQNGLLIPTEKCPPELLSDILRYFEERNEDE